MAQSAYQLIIVVLFSAIVAIGAALLARADGTSIPGAICYGSGVFAVSLGLIIAVMDFYRSSRS